MVSVIALSYVGFTNFNKPVANENVNQEVVTLTNDQIEFLKEKVGSEGFNLDDYQSYSYVGVHKNVLEQDDAMDTVAIKASFNYVMKGDEIIIVMPPRLDIASVLNGTVEQLMDPEVGWKDNKVIITSRIKHVVPSDDTIYSKIDNIAVSIEL